MMNAAISMMAGVEQTKARAMSNDLFSGQGEPKGVSFAKSFNERVAVPISSQGKNSADDLAIALSGLKGTTLTKKFEEGGEKSLGVKEKFITAPEKSVRSEQKGAAAGKMIQPQTTVVAGSQEKIAADDIGTTKIELPPQGEATADDVSSIPYAPTPGATDESPGSHVGIAGGDRPSVPLVLSGKGPVLQKAPEAVGKLMEDVSPKKNVKVPDSSEAQKPVQKTVAKIADTIAIAPKPVMGFSTEGAIAAGEQVVAPTVALQGEIGNATNAFGKAVSSVTKPSTDISSIAADRQIRKEVASGAKATATGTNMVVAAGKDPVTLAPKTDMSPEKRPAGTLPGGSDGAAKPQAVREPGAALLHSMGIVPTAVVSGNSPGELAATRLIGDAGTHTAGLSAGSGEPDGAGVVAPSVDGAPRMLTATPTSLEVGIQNGTHGWLKVRAEMTDGGVVNASVSAASSAGQEMLHRELPGLTAYLQQEKVAVNAVVVHAPSAAGADARSSSGMDGAGGQTPQRSNEGEQQHQSLRKATLNGPDETVSYRSSHGVDEDGSLPLAAYANGGNWLSVRA